MAKHPHKILLINNKTWKCVFGGCSFFVHIGLAHILVGKHATCWGCEESFIVDEPALREPKPRCIDCRLASLPDSPVTETEETEEEKKTREQREKVWRDILGK